MAVADVLWTLNLEVLCQNDSGTYQLSFDKATKMVAGVAECMVESADRASFETVRFK